MYITHRWGPSTCLARVEQNTHLIDMKKMCYFTKIKLIRWERVTLTGTVSQDYFNDLTGICVILHKSTAGYHSPELTVTPTGLLSWPDWNMCKITQIHSRLPLTWAYSDTYSLPGLLSWLVWDMCNITQIHSGLPLTWAHSDTYSLLGLLSWLDWNMCNITQIHSRLPLTWAHSDTYSLLGLLSWLDWNMCNITQIRSGLPVTWAHSDNYSFPGEDIEWK